MYVVNYFSFTSKVILILCAIFALNVLISYTFSTRNFIYRTDEIDGNLKTSKSVKVTLFYESYCPYSIKFVVNQLYPVNKLLSEYMIVDLVPYGKATRERVNDKWTFNCQHGEKECYGNKVHGCVLEQFKIKGQSESLKLLHCLMGTKYTGPEIEECFNKTSFDFLRYKRCMLIMADEIMAKHGERTDANEPKVTFVPLVMINDYFNRTLDNDAVGDLFGTVCHLLEPKPFECDE